MQKAIIQEPLGKERGKPASIWRQTDLAAALAVAAFCTMVLAFGIGQLWARMIGFGPSPASFIDYVPEVTHAFYPDTLPDVRVQKAAYQIGLLAIFLPFFLIVFGPARLKTDLLRRLRGSADRVRRLARAPLLFWGAVLAVWFVEVRRPQGDLIQQMSLWPLLLAVLLVIGLGGVAKCTSGAGWQRNAIRILTIASGALILFVEISGLLVRPDVYGWPYVTNTMVQAHFTFVVGAADRLGAGLRLFDEVRPYYGILPEALVGMAIRIFGPVNWAVLYRCVQMCQLAMFLCMVFAMLAWHGTRRPLLWLVLPSVLVMPDVLTGYGMNWFPNQTGWRFLGFGLALLALCLAPRISRTASLMLFGATASVALAWNPETGVVVVFGFIAYLATAASRPALSAGVLAASQLALAILAGLLLLASGFRLGLGYWPIAPSWEVLFSWYQTFLSGFGSLPMVDVDIAAIVVFVHCASILLRGALTWHLRPLSPERRLRMAIATMALAWLPYYVNRPQTLNLWTILYLYTPLLVTTLDYRWLAANWTGWLPKPTISLLAPVLVIALALNHPSPLPNVIAVFKPPAHPDGVEISGILMQPSSAKRITAQANFLQQLPDKESAVTFSANSFVLPLLTGLYPHLPARDLFWETLRESDFRRLVDRLFKLAPTAILFDTEDPFSTELPYGGDDRQKFYIRIKAAIAGSYVKSETDAGWEVWRPSSLSKVRN